MRPIYPVVSCEHAGNKIPVDYGKYFTEAVEVLDTHRGWDIGALSIAEEYAKQLDTKLFSTHISRLLVDCNRSIGNPHLFSVFTESLNQSDKANILDQYYHPYRQKVTQRIEELAAKGTVLHLSIHTFTPILNDEVRPMDIGLLYDENRWSEQMLCQKWMEIINHQIPKSTMLNAPYNGADDGFTTHLRKSFGDQNYIGIELEVNQKWAGFPYMDTLVQTSIASLKIALCDMDYQLVTL